MLFSVFALVEWNSGAFSGQDALTETPLPFQELWALLHSSGGCGLAPWAAEVQSEFRPRSDSKTNSAAAKKIPEKSCYWRHQGKMGSGRFWRQPSLIQVQCKPWWGIQGELMDLGRICLVSWSSSFICECLVKNWLCHYCESDCNFFGPQSSVLLQWVFL